MTKLRPIYDRRVRWIKRMWWDLCDDVGIGMVVIVLFFIAALFWFVVNRLEGAVR